MLDPASERTSARNWFICGLLLLATMINYMDRQTLSIAAASVKAEFGFNDTQYGHLETAFGLAFAAGSIVFGFICERFNVRFVYPVVLGGWSLATAAAAYSTGFASLISCRILLGFFEAGHWPCALITTFALLKPGERTMGNSVLQSGASIGAIITPQVMKWMATANGDNWRFAFQIIGLSGLAWIAVWLFIVKTADCAVHKDTSLTRDVRPLLPILRSKRLWAIAILIIGIQIPWHIIRAWLPLFLEKGRGYSPSAAKDFVSVYYIATDIGCLLAGAISLWLVRRFHMTAIGARRRIYAVCAITSCSSLLIPQLGQGWPLLALLLLLGAVSLAMFPCYYSFVQDLSADHVARLTGLFSMWVWLITSPMHSFFGMLKDKTGSYDLGIACAGLGPLLGLVALWLLWGKEPSAATTSGQ